MARCRGLNAFFPCVCAPFLADAPIRLEKRTMTVLQKATVTISLIWMQQNASAKPGLTSLCACLCPLPSYLNQRFCCWRDCFMLLTCLWWLYVFRRLPPAAGVRRALPGFDGGALREQSGGDLRGHEAGSGRPSHSQHLQDHRVTSHGHQQQPQVPYCISVKLYMNTRDLDKPFRSLLPKKIKPFLQVENTIDSPVLKVEIKMIGI